MMVSVCLCTFSKGSVGFERLGEFTVQQIQFRRICIRLHKGSGVIDLGS